MENTGNLIEDGLEQRPGQNSLERNRSPGLYSDIYGIYHNIEWLERGLGYGKLTLVLQL